LNNVDHEDRERDDQENMNEATGRIGRDDAQQPQNQQNYKYCPEHFYPFRRPCRCFLPGNLQAFVIGYSGRLSELRRRNKKDPKASRYPPFNTPKMLAMAVGDFGSSRHTRSPPPQPHFLSILANWLEISSSRP
jgi:hypothetical protein